VFSPPNPLQRCINRHRSNDRHPIRNYSQDKRKVSVQKIEHIFAQTLKLHQQAKASPGMLRDEIVPVHEKSKTRKEGQEGSSKLFLLCQHNINRHVLRRCTSSLSSKLRWSRTPQYDKNALQELQYAASTA
jgi:hypothetical protein